MSLWTKFKQWDRKWRYGGAAIGGLALGAIGLGGLNFTMYATNSTEFCISCHEMRDTVYEEYKKSIHFTNASGVRAECSDCHVAQEWGLLVLDKINAYHDVYHSWLGSIDTAEKFEAKRLTLAKRVWDEFKANDSHGCRSCHSFDAMDPHKQKPESVKGMEKAATDGSTCIDCHKGIAHKMPDTSSGYRALFDELKGMGAALDPKAGDTVYTIVTMPFHLAKPGNEAGDGDGKILPPTPLKVIGRDGSWLEVEVTGWRQEGAERMIYALQGKRIFVAALGPDAIDKVVAGKTVLDPDTDQNWSEATLTAWVKNEGIVGDQDKVLAYGAEMYGTGCGLCHTLTPTDHYLANQWIGTLNAMKRFVNFTDEEYRFLQKYVQLHASDTGGAE